MQGGTLKTVKASKATKILFQQIKEHTVSQIMDHRANSMGKANPKSWKSGKTLTSIELSLFDPVHFRIEHK